MNDQPDNPQPGNPQPKNPLHGKTLKAILEYLVEHIGWAEMAHCIDINCFRNDPSINSSLKFLRTVGWARTKVENLYLRVRRRIGD